MSRCSAGLLGRILEGAGGQFDARGVRRRRGPRAEPEVCLARTLRSEVEVLFWSPIGGIQHRRQGRGPELTGRSQCGQVWRCGASVRAGLKEAVDASWWRTKVKRRKAFLGGASRPLAAMPDSYCWFRGRSGDAVTTKSQRFTQGDLLGPGRVGR